MKQIQQVKQDHRGLTLIELMIGIAILAVVAIIVIRNILTGSKMYGSGRDEANLQMELQYVVNYISGEMMECEKLICDSSNQYYLLCKSKDHGLLIYKKSLTERGLYQRTYHMDIDSYSDGSLSLESLLSISGIDEFELSKYVTTISITNESSRTASIEITVEKDGKTKSCKKQVNLRNAS